MKAKFCILLAMIVAVSASAGVHAFSNDGVKNYLTDKADKNSLKAFHEKGCEVAKNFGKIASLRCPESSAGALGLREDLTVYAMDINADRQINADDVWSLGYAGTGRLVAVVDTGIDYNHTELSDSYAGGWNFVAGNNNPYDDNGHGTHVSGIITANGADINAKGAAPDARILALKVLDSKGSGSFSSVIAAIYYAVDGSDGVYGTSDDFHPDAISMSLGTSSPYLYTGADCDSAYPEMTNAVNYAVSHGVAVVAAAGNDGRGVSIPGCISGAIAVGAVNANDTRPSWSGAGDSLDIAAPGVGIYSTWPSGYYTASGTSMATPHVSAVVALLKQADSGLSVSQIKNALYKTAKDLGASGWDKYYGWGLVDALAAVSYVINTSAPPAISHDIAVTDVQAPASVVSGESISVYVTVANEGNANETFSVMLMDTPDNVTIGSESVTLAAGASQIIIFNWNTSAASLGSHMLIAAAEIVSGENDTSDNVKTISVMVTEPPAPVHDVSISSISAPASVVSGSVATIIVVAENAGNQPETFTVTLSEDMDNATIGSRVVSLDAGASRNLSFSWNTSSSSEGNHTVKAEAGAVLGENNTENNAKTAVIAITLPPPQPKMHIAGVDMATQRNGANIRAKATITVVDESGNPVSGVNVSGHWSGLTIDSDTGITDSSGKVTVYSDWKKKAKGTFTFTVDNLVKSGMDYDSSADVAKSGNVTV